MSLAAAPPELPPGRPGGGTWLRGDGRVDSVQWVLIPAQVEPAPLALERAYHAWGGRLCGGILGPYWSAADPQQELRIAFHPWGRPNLIRLGALHADAGQSYREILGGLLARAGGHLAFELEPRPAGTVLTVAVRGLCPRLPPPLYLRVQRRLHERATFAFLRQCVRQLTPETEAKPLT